MCKSISNFSAHPVNQSMQSWKAQKQMGFTFGNSARIDWKKFGLRRRSVILSPFSDLSEHLWFPESISLVREIETT